MKVLLVSFFLFGLSFGEYKYGDDKPEELSCDCGWKNEKGVKRLVGATETGENDYPWMAAIMSIEESGLELECGGTIITPWHVLTAAHCTDEKSPGEIVLCIGAKNVTNCEPDKKTIEVDQIIMKDNFDEDNMIRDIAIVVPKTKIDFTQFVGPACFPSKVQTDELESKTLKLIGWGYKDDHNSITNLSELDVEVKKWDTCKTRFTDLDMDKTQVCTYASNNGACGGFVGNPLVLYDQDVKRYTIIALASYGPDDCIVNSNTASVNTNVTSFISWVTETVAAKESSVVCSF